MLSNGTDLIQYIGSQLKSYRSIKGLTQKQLAKQLNLTTQAVNNYERGKRMIPADTLLHAGEILEFKAVFIKQGEIMLMPTHETNTPKDLTQDLNAQELSTISEEANGEFNEENSLLSDNNSSANESSDGSETNKIPINEVTSGDNQALHEDLKAAVDLIAEKLLSFEEPDAFTSPEYFKEWLDEQFNKLFPTEQLSLIWKPFCNLEAFIRAYEQWHIEPPVIFLAFDSYPELFNQGLLILEKDNEPVAYLEFEFKLGVMFKKEDELFDAQEVVDMLVKSQALEKYKTFEEWQNATLFSHPIALQMVDIIYESFNQNDFHEIGITCRSTKST